MKKIAFFDLDNTIFSGQTFFMFVKYEIERGRVSHDVWEGIEELLDGYKNKSLTYKEAADQMLDIFAQALSGEKYEEVLQDAESFFEENKDKFYPYFMDMHRKLAETHDIYIVTTNIQFIAEAAVKKFGLAGYISTQYGVNEGYFNGEVEKSLAGNKHIVLELLDQYGREGSLAVGDSENDIEMLALVANPICIDSNEALEAVAREKGWTLTTNQEIPKHLLRI